MVQLPATAAIEYVAACWVPGAGGIFVRETRTRTKTKTVRGAYGRSPKFNAYTHRIGGLPCWWPYTVDLAGARWTNKQTKNKTRMVQLPATAAIEYVAACCRTRTRTRTRTKTKSRTKTKTKTETKTRKRKLER